MEDLALYSLALAFLVAIAGTLLGLMGNTSVFAIASVFRIFDNRKANKLLDEAEAALEIAEVEEAADRIMLVLALDLQWLSKKNKRRAIDVVAKIFEDHKQTIGLAFNETSLLCLLSEFERVDLVEVVLANGGDVNKKDIGGRTPLQIALENRCLELCRTYLEHGAYQGIENNRGLSCLHIALDKKDVDLVKLLLGYPANLEAKDNNGMSLLLRSIVEKKWNFAKLFIEAGARVYAKSPSGETALHIAASSGNPEIVGLLLDRGADVNAKVPVRVGDKTTHVITPLEVAKRNGHAEVVGLLRQHGGHIIGSKLKSMFDKDVISK